MAKPTIAIGMDAAEPEVIASYLRRGLLPHMKRILEGGAWADLQNYDVFSAELPWTTFATGVRPLETGYWSPLRYDAQRYEVVTRAAYEFEEYPPFYALGSEYRVAAFDVPQVRAHPGLNGVQVQAWGAHSPQVPSGSVPEGLFEELVRKHGDHPGLHDDYGECLRTGDLEGLKQKLVTGIRRRGLICRDLLSRERWDLFVTVFGEPHSAGHNFWQVSWPDHPLYDILKPRVQGDPMLETYQAIDQAIGTMMEAAPEDAQVVIFSAHGMGPNTMDLPSTTFLPELMFRYSFPGEKALEGKTGEPLPAPYTECGWWMLETWLSRHEKNPARRLFNRNVPYGVHRRLAKMFPDADVGPGKLLSPLSLEEKTDVVPWQPAHWFKGLWPKMKAFALPSFSEGYVRLNVVGRDPQGVVAASDYDRVCDEIIDKVRATRDARRGVPMVRKAVRTRRDPLDADPRLPDADIVFAWQEEYATDTIDSPDFGRIGPLPHLRSGSHRHRGFAIIRAPDHVEAGAKLTEGHALDIAPTVLELMGAPRPSQLGGLPLTGARPPLSDRNVFRSRAYESRTVGIADC